MKLIFFHLLCLLIFFVFEVVLLAQDNNLDSEQSTFSEHSVGSEIVDKATGSEGQAGKKKLDPKKKVVTEKTSFDFDEALLEGKVKTPNVLILRGRSKQPKSQLIQLKTSFRNEIYKSKPSIRGIK